MQEAGARALVDGRALALADATLPVTDAGVARGDGVFETIGVWDGRPFRLEDHLARLAASAAAAALPPPDRAILRDDVDRLCTGGRADAALRLYVTASGTRVATLSPLPSRPPPRVLIPQVAPWIRPRGVVATAGAKTMSYLPHMAATRRAVAAGGDDALLVTEDGIVLEGATTCVVWVVDGVLRTPDPALGIVDSTSRRALLELAGELRIAAEVGRWRVEDLARAQAVCLCSSIRPLQPVARVGDVELPAPPDVVARLGAALDARRRRR